MTSPYSSQDLSEKVALMYINDYAFASEQKIWGANSGGYASAENWLFTGEEEYLLTGSNDDKALIIGSNKSIKSVTNPAQAFRIRPCFYLNSSVTYQSGTGTSSDPIRIS